MKNIKPILVIGLIIILIGAGAAYLFGFEGGLENTSAVTPVEEISKDDTGAMDIDTLTSPYQKYIDNISSGGPPKDGIPPVESPVYITIEEVGQRMMPYDKVFVYEGNTDTFIYPQNILVWHEIVNDVIDGDQLSVTYCPLTGSTICYIGDVADYEDNTYGTSGTLLNSNLVMYDRASDSYIPQILGIGINGALEGIALQTKPIVWANWKDAIETYPEAKVLSTETGFLRDYDRDPYGTYQPEDNKSYYANDGVMFPLMNQHEGLYSDKKVVVGVKFEDAVIAIDPAKVREEKVLPFDIGSEQAIALWDESLKTVRVFNRALNGELLNFVATSDGYQDQYDRRWSYQGSTHDDLKLEHITYFDVMWFAWYAYYPETEVIQ